MRCYLHDRDLFQWSQFRLVSVTMRNFSKDGSFVLSLKRVYIERLPTITKQCITICYTVDTILQLIDHVSAHAKNGILRGWHLLLLQVSINRFPKRNLADVGPGMNQ